MLFGISILVLISIFLIIVTISNLITNDTNQTHLISKIHTLIKNKINKYKSDSNYTEDTELYNTHVSYTMYEGEIISKTITHKHKKHKGELFNKYD